MSRETLQKKKENNAMSVIRNKKRIPLPWNIDCGVDLFSIYRLFVSPEPRLVLKYRYTSRRLCKFRGAAKFPAVFASQVAKDDSGGGGGG